MTILDEVKASRRKAKAALEALSLRMTVSTASEARSLQPRFDAGVAELQTFDDRIEELHEVELREAAAAHARIEPGHQARFTTNDADVYHDPHADPHGPSFFRDMRNSRLGDWAAAERLQRNQAARGMETRAGDMTTVAGAGGQFAPPLWLVQEFVQLARPGRITADLVHKEVLPGGVASINLPKVSGGATTAVQALQNTAVSDTAMTTTSVSSGITTIAGKQIVSLQLLAQSGIPFDRVILGDLAADYAKQIDLQVISGSGAAGQLRGLLNGAGVGATTFTSATPAVTSTTAANSFYNKLVSSVNSVYTARFQAPTAIIMHPVRWSWILEAIDTATRPLVVPDGSVFNSIGTATGGVAQGNVGTILGLPVYLDPNIPVNLGAGVNEDRVFVLKADDVYLYESELQMESFEATYADQASCLFRALAYSALIPDRFGASVNVVAGTGLVAPVL
jgi:HK97 family phage major capsid protein